MAESFDNIPRAEVPHFDYDGAYTLVLPELGQQEPVTEHIINKLGRGATGVFYDYDSEPQQVIPDYETA